MIKRTSSAVVAVEVGDSGRLWVAQPLHSSLASKEALDPQMGLGESGVGKPREGLVILGPCPPAHSH